MLAKAKKAGETPISFGNLDKFGPASTSSRPSRTSSPSKDATRNFVFAKGGASFDTSENKEAATKLQEWAKKGYFTKDFNGTGYDPAWQQFTKGKGPFTIAGTWIYLRRVQGAGPDKLGFFLMPGQRGGRDPVSLGGESLPWAITSKSKNADVAAAYIDFITNAEAADVQVETGNLPATAASVRPKSPARRTSSPPGRISTTATASRRTWTTRRRRSIDDFSGAVQKLMAGKTSPDAFTKSMQEDYAKFTDTL